MASLRVVCLLLLLLTGGPVLAQITYITEGTGTGNNSATITLAATPAAGDLLIAHVATDRTDRTLTMSGTGWTTLRSDVAPSGCTPGTTCTVKTSIVYKFHVVSDPTTYTLAVSGGGSRKVSGGISVYRGVSTIAPFIAHGATASAGTSATTDAPSLSPSSAPAGAMLVALYAVGGEATYSTLPATYAARYTVVLSKAGAGHPTLAVATRGALAGAEVPALQSATASTAAYANIGIHLALREGNLSHYGITAPSGTTFATCEPAVLQITPHSVTHGAIAHAPGVVLNLTTSNGTGVWQPFSAGAGDLGIAANFVPSGLDNGQATYTWSGVESVLRVRLLQTSIGNFTVNLSDGTLGEDATEDPTITVASAAVRVTDAAGAAAVSVGTQIAAKPSNTGVGAQSLYIQALRAASATVCSAVFQNQTVNVEVAAVCENPAACSAAAGTAVEVQNNVGTYVSVAKNNGPGAPAAYTTVPMTFSNDALAIAPLVFRYGDAGQIALHFRVPLPSPPANKFTTGSSNAFVVRPFGLHVSATQGADHNSALLAIAGENFPLSVTAYKWVAGEDDGSGNPAAGADITDNGTTPSFAATATLTPVANLAGAALGAVARGASCASPASIALAAGTAAAADWCYSEVGNVLLKADVTDYLSSGINVTGNSGLNDGNAANGHVGRFGAKKFTLSGGSVTHRASAACTPASTFSYMDEDMTLNFTLTARNAQDAITQNYTGSYAKLNVASVANLGLVALEGASVLTGRIDSGSSSAGSWSAGGTAAVSVTTAIRRATPDSPDGPRNVVFGIAPVDSDNAAMGSFDLDAVAPAGNDHSSIGITAPVRFGRLRLHNVIGSERLPLQVPATLEYWNGSSFAINTADNCTTLAQSNFSLGFTAGSNLTACETAVTGAPVTFAAGAGSIRLSAPGTGNHGSLLLTAQLRSTASGNYCPAAGGAALPATAAIRSYLLGRWSDAADPDASASTAYDDNPAARAAFGVYGSQPKNFIFFRENY